MYIRGFKKSDDNEYKTETPYPEKLGSGKYINKKFMLLYLQSCSVQFSSAQPLSHIQLIVTPWTAAH